MDNVYILLLIILGLLIVTSLTRKENFAMNKLSNIEVGSVLMDREDKTFNFNNKFSKPPVIKLQVLGNGNYSTTIRDVDREKFSVNLKKINGDGMVKIQYLAIENPL